jgi:hypothetical protein
MTSWAVLTRRSRPVSTGARPRSTELAGRRGLQPIRRTHRALPLARSGRARRIDALTRSIHRPSDRVLVPTRALVVRGPAASSA